MMGLGWRVWFHQDLGRITQHCDTTTLPQYDTPRLPHIITLLHFPYFSIVCTTRPLCGFGLSKPNPILPPEHVVLQESL